MSKRSRKLLTITGFLAVVAVVTLWIQLPTIASALIIHPYKRTVSIPLPDSFETVTFQGDGIKLQGWHGNALGNQRGTMIYLHGVADNRASGEGVMRRFQKSGFDVIAYDSRAHGDSGGAACTYGYHEKNDLRRVLDTVRPGPVILIGSSLGAAVSLQLAAEEPRVSALISAEAFSDLRTVATDRAPFFFTAGMIAKSFAIAEEQGNFRIDDANPAVAAKSIKCPVLVIHGADDVDTRPDHAERIFNALTAPKRLILVSGAAHNQSLASSEVWQDIETWVDSVVPR